MAKNQNDNGQNSGMDGRELPLIGVLLGGAWWYKYGHAVQVWFHENLIELAIYSAIAITLIGYFVIWRMKKNSKKELKRFEVLANVKPGGRSVESYYRNPTRGGED
jgi:hypothetical protein